MASYIALIDGSPGAYGLSFPDCLGCTAMGSTPDEAIANGVEALREWMADRVKAGLAPPSGRSIEALRGDPDWADEMADAIVAAIPLLLDAGRSVRANVSLDAGLLGQIDEAARQRGLTRSAFLASAAREKIAARR